MTQKEKIELEQTIKTNIATLQDQILTLEEKTKPIAPDCSLGRLTRLEAMGEQDVANKVIDETQNVVNQIVGAETVEVSVSDGVQGIESGITGAFETL